MDRKGQLGNVAFGGDWSENIAPKERIEAALSLLQAAVDDCEETDPRTKETREALDFLTANVARGHMLNRAFWNATSIEHPCLRRNELKRALDNLRKVVGIVQ